MFELVTSTCKNCKTSSSVPKPEDTHIIATCLVVLALVGVIIDENGKEQCIPVTVNPHRNSYLGIVPIKFEVCRYFLF